MVLEAGEQTTPEALRHRLAHGRASKGPGRKILERGIEVPERRTSEGRLTAGTTPETQHRSGT